MSIPAKALAKIKAVERLTKWLNAMPQPPIAVEFSPERVCAVRWSRAGDVKEIASAPLPRGALVASAVERNFADHGAISTALTGICQSLQATDEMATLLLPDSTVRVFIMQFEEFPVRQQEAVSFLRWKLKRSLPFEVSDTSVFYVLQSAKGTGVEVVVVVARLRIVREYEELAREAGVDPGVVTSSPLAALTLMDAARPTLFARISDTVLTTALVRDGLLCGYRCTELPMSARELTPEALLAELYPVAAYYQDVWKAPIEAVRLTGAGSRFADFMPAIENEFHCPVAPLLDGSTRDKCAARNAQELVEGELTGLLGCMLSCE